MKVDSPVYVRSPIEYYKRRYTKARATADLWMSLLEACYHYTVPNRNLFYWTSQYQGAQKNARVYDTTAVSAVRKFVAKIQTALTPPQQIWALLETGTDVSADQKEEIDLKLKEITNIIFNFIRNSNFDVVINECYFDLAIGTAALICNEGPPDRPLLFYSVPLARIAVEESSSGLLENNWRWWDEIRISDIQDLWPKAKLSPLMMSLLKEDPTAKIKNLVEGTIINQGYKNLKNKFIYVLFHEENILLEENMESSPWITFRWSKVNNEVYGRGPVIDALPSILTLNEIARIELVSANMNISKPIMAYNDGVFNPWTFKLEPNTIIPVAPNNNGQFPLQPFPDTANPQFMQFTSNDLRMQINTLLYADPLGPIEAPTKTATELALRQRNLAEEVGPLFIRLQQEFLSRVIDRVIYILQKNLIIPKIMIEGKEIKLRYQSPLVSAQGFQEIEVFTNWYGLMQNIYGPETSVRLLNPVEMPRWSADKMGVDPTALLTKEEIAQSLQIEADQVQQQQQMMQEEMLNARQKPAARSA